MDSNRDHIEERLLLDLQRAKERLSAAYVENGEHDAAFSVALEAYSAALQTFTNFVLYGRLPADSQPLKKD